MERINILWRNRDIKSEVKNTVLKDEYIKGNTVTAHSLQMWVQLHVGNRKYYGASI